MVEFTLPANSRVRPGKTFKAPAGATRIKNFKIYRYDPDTGENREDLIYMNHPLRYGGLTFYQAGFENNDSTSIFQVVRNPVWTVPYISCAMVGLGLLWVFSQHLIKAISRRNKLSPTP